jgi:ABC-type transporter Mla subunit MlaD
MVTYKHPTRLIAGSPIYFRGIQIGRIEKVALAPNANRTDVILGIFKERLHLAKTVQIYTREQLFGGQRYIEIVPNDQPSTIREDYIHNGDILTGVEPVNMDKLEEQLSRIANDKGIEKLVDSTHETMVTVTGSFKQLKSLGIDAQHFVRHTEEPTNRALKQLTATSRQISVMAGNVRDFSSSAKDSIPKLLLTSQHFVNNTNKLPQTLESVGDAAEQTNKTLTSVNTQLVQSNLVPNLSNTLSGLNHSQVLENAATLFQSLHQTSTRIDCTTAQASHILGQRFLGFKILFNKPGGGYPCDKINLKLIDSNNVNPTSHYP